MSARRAFGALCGTLALGTLGCALAAAAAEPTRFVARLAPGVRQETLELLADAALPERARIEAPTTLRELIDSHYGVYLAQLEALLRAQNPALPADGKLVAGTEVALPAGPRWSPSRDFSLAPGEDLGNPLRLYMGTSGPRTVERVLSANGLESDRNLRPERTLTVDLPRVEARSFELRPEYEARAAEVLTALHADPNVLAYEYGEPSELRRPSPRAAAPACEAGDANWPVDRESLMRILARNRRVSREPLAEALVAVADSGIDPTEGRLLLWRNPDEDGYQTGEDDDLCGYVDDIVGADLLADGRFAAYPAAAGEDLGFRDHGTHVAGLVQGGVGDACLRQSFDERMRIMVLKVSEHSLDGNVERLRFDEGALANAPAFARLHGADVVNLSMENAHPLASALNAAIRDSRGMLFVVAAGNGIDGVGQEMGPATGYQVAPANLGGRDGVGHVVTVAAHDANRAPAPFSNYGPSSVDLAAPGCAVESLATGGRTARYDGTSMSAGVVSMTAALLRSEGVDHPVRIRNRLLASVDPVPALRGKVNAGGVLDPVKALAIYDDWVELADETFLLGDIQWPAELVVKAVEPPHPVLGRYRARQVLKIVPLEKTAAGLRARVAHVSPRADQPGSVVFTEGLLTPERLTVKTAWETRELDLAEVADVVPRMRRTPLGKAELFTLPSLPEPSGLSGTSLPAPGKSRFLAVDDDDRLLRVVDDHCGGLTVVQTVEFPGIQPNDLEALAYDGTRYHYAVTSHRRLGDDHREVRRAVRFELRESDLGRYVGGGSLPDGSLRDLSEGLAALLEANGVAVDRAHWAQPRDGDAHPYALEIEGAAVREGRLLLGLRWPLDGQGRALIAEYDWDADAFEALHRVDLGGQGISGMDQFEDALLLATNPPVKERDGDDAEALGRSQLCSLAWGAGQAEPGTPTCVPAPLERAKLEGIFTMDDRAWLAYDGGKPATLGGVSPSRLSFRLRRSVRLW